MPEAGIVLYMLGLDCEPKSPHTTLLPLVNELEVKIHGGGDDDSAGHTPGLPLLSSSLAFVGATGDGPSMSHEQRTMYAQAHEGNPEESDKP